MPSSDCTISFVSATIYCIYYFFCILFLILFVSKCLNYDQKKKKKNIPPRPSMPGTSLSNLWNKYTFNAWLCCMSMGFHILLYFMLFLYIMVWLFLTPSVQLWAPCSWTVWSPSVWTWEEPWCFLLRSFLQGWKEKDSCVHIRKAEISPYYLLLYLHTVKVSVCFKCLTASLGKRVHICLFCIFLYYIFVVMHLKPLKSIKCVKLRVGVL